MFLNEENLKALFDMFIESYENIIDKINLVGASLDKVKIEIVCKDIEVATNENLKNRLEAALSSMDLEKELDIEVTLISG